MLDRMERVGLQAGLRRARFDRLGETLRVIGNRGGDMEPEVFAFLQKLPGIRTMLRTFEWGNYLNNMGYVHKAGPLWLIGWGTATYDAETVYVPLFRSGKIISNYHNADFDGMIDEAQTVMDAKRRQELYTKINRLWVEDAAAMPLYQQLDLYGATKRMVWKARGDELIKGYDMAIKDDK